MLPLTYFVHGYGSLSAAFETIDFGITFLCMLLADTAIDPFPPKVETTPFELPAHNGDHFRLGNTKLKLDGIKGRAVFPSHFNDTVEIVGGHCGRIDWSCRVEHMLIYATIL